MYFIVDDVGRVSLAIETSMPRKGSTAQILDVRWFSRDHDIDDVQVLGEKAVVSTRCINSLTGCSGKRITLGYAGEGERGGILLGHFPPAGICVDIKTVEGFTDAVALTVNASVGTLQIVPVDLPSRLLENGKGLRLCATLCGRSGNGGTDCTPSLLNVSARGEDEYFKPPPSPPALDGDEKAKVVAVRGKDVDGGEDVGGAYLACIDRSWMLHPSFLLCLSRSLSVETPQKRRECKECKWR